LIAVCVLAAGVVVAALPTTEFTVEWRHSVEKTRWQERYRVDGRQIVLTSASIEAMGAGMEPPPDARFANGRWTWEPMRSMTELRLTRSPYVDDYTICWNGVCRPLSALVGEKAEAASFRACRNG
jgi:hypothetical protein